MANKDLGVSQDLAKSDTPNAKFDWVMVVTTSGTLVVDHDGGNTTTLASVPTNVWIPMSNGTNIQTASTAVGFVVV